MLASSFFTRNRAYTSRHGLDPFCRECKSQRQRTPEHRLSTRRANIKRRYGISMEEYDRAISKGCSACGSTSGRIVMDHCHATGRVRGPLCNRCNVLLGQAGEDPVLLRALADHSESTWTP